ALGYVGLVDDDAGPAVTQVDQAGLRGEPGVVLFPGEPQGLDDLEEGPVEWVRRAVGVGDHHVLEAAAGPGLDADARRRRVRARRPPELDEVRRVHEDLEDELAGSVEVAGEGEVRGHAGSPS